MRFIRLSLGKLIQEFVHGGWVLDLLIVRRERLQRKKSNYDKKIQSYSKISNDYRSCYANGMRFRLQ